MCRKPKPTATILAALIVGAAAHGPASAWPFGAKTPASAPAAAQTAPSSKTPDASQKKATPQERIAADRLDPISRSAFWAREFQVDPTDAQAGIELAASLRTLGHYKDAADTVAKVLVLYPDNLDALLESARSAVASGKGFYALEPLRRAEKVAPRDWRVYSLMGLARDQNQQPDEARSAYGQALALSPNNPAVLSNLGLWYATHHQPTQAETYLRQAVAQPTASAQERQNLALVLGMEGKLAEAERLMREDLPPEVASSNMAYLQAMSGRGSPTP
jgi:Flp pilus assembly protein TadD